MPKFVIAHRSGAHRLAATALYRALVSQCKKLDIPAEHGDELHNLIKNRFTGFRHTTSHRELKLLFEAGYEAVNHLDAAVAGEEKSKQYILALLRRAPYSAKKGNTVTRRFVSEDYNDPFGSNDQDGQARSVVGEGSASLTGLQAAEADAGKHDREEVQKLQVKPLISKRIAKTPLFRKYYVDWDTEESQNEYAQAMSRKKPSGNDSANERDHQPIRYIESEGQTVYIPLAEPDSVVGAARTSIFERAIPREELGGTGKRQIPKIFSANQIPVLRFKKPQSPALTGYLNSRIEQRQKRHNLRQTLEAQLQVAVLEDQWDRILDAHADVNRAELEDNQGFGYMRMEPRWEKAILYELNRVNERLDDEKAKNRAMAEKMYGVIDRETKLLEEERQQERMEEARRKREMAEGLEGLSDMVDDIMDDIMEAAGSEYRPLS